MSDELRAAHLDDMSDHASTSRPARAKTIAANGEIIDKPYGPSRWASPRRYGCAHPGCSGAAATTAPAGSHGAEDMPRAHNCCGQH